MNIISWMSSPKDIYSYKLLTMLVFGVPRLENEEALQSPCRHLDSAEPHPVQLHLQT